MYAAFFRLLGSQLSLGGTLAGLQFNLPLTAGLVPRLDQAAQGFFQSRIKKLRNETAQPLWETCANT